MRYGPDDRFWVVTDPKQESTLGDIFFAASLRELELQIKGGLVIADNPTLFTDRAEAETEARTRLLAMRVATAIAKSGAVKRIEDVVLVQLCDKSRIVLFEKDLGPEEA
jgi:hypothetical protein